MHNINLYGIIKFTTYIFSGEQSTKRRLDDNFCHLLKYIHVYNKDIFVFATRNNKLKLI